MFRIVPILIWCLICSGLSVAKPLTIDERVAVAQVIKRLHLVPGQPWYVEDAYTGRLSARELRQAFPARWTTVNNEFLQTERKLYGVTSYTFLRPEHRGNRIVFDVITNTLEPVGGSGSTQRYTCLKVMGRWKLRVKTISAWIAEDLNMGNGPEPKSLPPDEIDPPPRAKPSQSPTITPIP